MNGRRPPEGCGVADLDDVQLGYKLSGGLERVVVLAGGTGMPPVTWEITGLAGELEANGYGVLTYAARGVVPSSAPPPPYAVADLAADLEGLLEHLAIDTCDVVGYSLGGFTVELLMRNRPDLIRSAVLLASAGPLNPILRTSLEMGADLLARCGSLPGSASRFAELMVLLPPTVLRDDYEQVEEWLALLDARTEGWTSSAGEAGQSSAAYTWMHDPGRMAALGAITTPTLVASFEHDPIFTPAGGRTASGLIPNSVFTEIPGAAHGGLMTHSPACTQAIIEFLRSA